MRSFTAEELERATGFDRRTIAYYVQEGLIPRVGRRGPRTRYPKLVKDRLLFIRRVREAEEAGEIGAISLNEMRSLFDRVSPEAIELVAERRLPIVATIEDAAASGYRSAASRREAMERAWSTVDSSAEMEPVFSAQARSPGSRAELEDEEFDEASLGAALLELQIQAGHRRVREPGSPDMWSRIEISPEIALSVRGLAEEDTTLLESVARKLRRLIGG